LFPAPATKSPTPAPTTARPPSTASPVDGPKTPAASNTDVESSDSSSTDDETQVETSDDNSAVETSVESSDKDSKDTPLDTDSNSPNLKSEEEAGPWNMKILNGDAVKVETLEDSSQGPVLALSLGLAITLLMLIFVGCRLRTVKRRLRKGRALNSNEADYLINGMYL